MKTKFVNAEDVPGNAKIVLDGIVRQICYCDYVDPIWSGSPVRFDFEDGHHVVIDACDAVETVVE